MSSAASTSLHPLVTQNLVETKKYYCPFLERGYCREAARCHFSHDTQASIRIPIDYCHFYLANQCLYGQECKFRHSEPEADEHFEDAHPNTGLIFTYSDDSLPIEYDPDVVGHYYALASASTTSIVERGEEIQDDDDDDDDDDHDDDDDEDEEDYEDAADEEEEDEDVGNSDGEQSRKFATRGHAVHEPNSVTNDGGPSISNYKRGYPLCPYSATNGICPFPPGQCSYLHGDDCDLCGRPCLHPFDPEQKRQHREDCLKEHEREMELSFAVQRSKDKVCGICMDTVVEKKPITTSRFGILEKCNHIFCLDCIRKWRGTKHFETRTIRACPECRVSSDFVVPSKYWVEDQDDKEKLIRDYKAALRYFDEGKGECPFAGSCFYKHAYPDGRIAEMDPPKPRRRLFGSRGHTSNVANYILWNILASTDDDEWSNEDLESLHYDPDYGTSDEEYELGFYDIM